MTYTPLSVDTRGAAPFIHSRRSLPCARTDRYLNPAHGISICIVRSHAHNHTHPLTPCDFLTRSGDRLPVDPYAHTDSRRERGKCHNKWYKQMYRRGEGMRPP